MGKTSKPLTIIALPPCDQWDELDKLEKQGHTVIRLQNDQDSIVAALQVADIVLGSNCWRMDHQHKTYVSLAIKEARLLKYSHEDSHDVKKRKSVSDDIGLDGDNESSNGVSDE